MNGRSRVLLVFTASLALGLAAVAVLYVLPPPRPCLSSDCGPNFHSGAVHFFGTGNFTLAQTTVMAVGIFVTAWLLASAALSWRRWLSAGLAALALALVIAWSLESPPIAPAPSVPCTSPDAGGRPVLGRCTTGAPRVDPRIGLRLLVIAAGMSAVVVAAARDASLRRSRPSPPLAA